MNQQGRRSIVQDVSVLCTVWSEAWNTMIGPRRGIRRVSVPATKTDKAEGMYGVDGTVRYAMYLYLHRFKSEVAVRGVACSISSF
jgi:hypothetical protein